MRGLVTIPVAVLLLLPVAALVLNGNLRVPSRAEASPVVPVASVPSTPEEETPEPAPVPVQPEIREPEQSTPEPPPAPPAWVKAEALETAVAEAMDGFSGEYSVIVQDVATGDRWTHNPDQRYHPASTIKMPVTLYTLEQYRAGKITWQDGIVYTPADFESPGGGAFETAEFGGVYPIENLVNRSLIYSNNVAVNMLGRHFGWRNIEAWTRTIDGELFRGPEVTALSELGWWLHLHKLSQEDPESAELLLAPLRQVAYDGRITAGLPAEVPHLHKFGSYNGNYHDGGIIYTDQPYILIVLTGGGTVDEADAAIARVSTAVYQVMTEQAP